MAVPHDVEVMVYSVRTFAEQSARLSSGSQKKTIVLFSTIADALRAYRLVSVLRTQCGQHLQ
jgi:hypothetical protein